MATLREIFSKAIGNRGFSLLKCEGEPATYKMLVEWETIADHRDRFRASREFNEMGELLSKYFDRPAELHYTYRVFDARA